VPRVSEHYQAMRRQHILHAARACFSRLGFHATSMQDILREADTSAGALYCYFSSKDDIVAAIVDEVLDDLFTRFEEAASADQPLSSCDVADQLFSVFDHSEELARLAVQIWAESLHDPLVTERIARGYRRLRRVLLRIAPKATVHLLIGLGPAYLQQRALLGRTEANAFRASVLSLLADR
jgi:AcrR family transcriptional regulator